MDALLILVLPVCLFTAFLCAGMEAGIFALGRWRIAQQMREGRTQAARLYAYLQNTENFLWTILAGNMTSAFFGLWLVGVTLIKALPERPVMFWSSFLASVFVFYAFCDLLPKMLFRTYPNRLCLLASTPFRLVHLAFAPMVWVIEGMTNLLLRWTGGKVFKGQVFSSRGELRQLMEDTSENLTSEERGMIGRVFDMNNISVRTIATPFSRFPRLTTDNLVGEALNVFRDFPSNLLPVWSADPKRKRIAGFLNLKEMLFHPPSADGETLSRRLSPPFYLEEDARVQDALRRMQRSGSRMAVVVSRDRKEIALITLEEMLKVIFGEVKL